MKADDWAKLERILRKAEQLDRQHFEGEAEVLGWYPNPPGEDPYAEDMSRLWLFHILFPPLSEAELGELAEQVGRPIPDDLATFYTERSNGLDMFSGGISIYGLQRKLTRDPEHAPQTYSLVDAAVEWPDVFADKGEPAEDHLFFFGGWGEDVMPLALDERDGSILATSRESPSEVLGRWPSLSDFLLNQAEALAHLFDEEGRRRPADELPAGLELPPDAA